MSDTYSNTASSGYWMPNREIRVVGAGELELKLALRLAFGERKIFGYRVDRHSEAGDELWLFSEGGDEALPPGFYTADNKHDRSDMVGYFPTPVKAEQAVQVLLPWLYACRMPKEPMCDGSVERGGFLLRHDGDGIRNGDRLACLMGAWREFHK